MFMYICVYVYLYLSQTLTKLPLNPHPSNHICPHTPAPPTTLNVIIIHNCGNADMDGAIVDGVDYHGLSGRRRKRRQHVLHKKKYYTLHVTRYNEV